ncbi:MAG: MBL fold metallo-hydrolase RNA specificity domain-containing protein [Cytophagaceae bacterium]
MAKLSFLGAAKQVTGSMFLLELKDGYKILIDCGRDLEHVLNNDHFPFNPEEINLVLLTHAHLDHCGNIPVLIKKGYKGQILCTGATEALSNIVLNDTASINVKRRQKSFSKNKQNKKALNRCLDTGLFYKQDVEASIDKFVSLTFDQTFQVNKDVSVKFVRAGHLLGAAHIIVYIRENNNLTSICFSGDIGRKNSPLLQDPSPVERVDYLVTEGTYGNRLHLNKEHPEEYLEKIITHTCVEKRGRLIIPSFSIGRTQTILYLLNRLKAEGKLPPIKVFTDSPMAKESTAIHEKYLMLLNKDCIRFLEKHGSLFDFDNLIFAPTLKESLAVSNYNEPCIILSSSGMITGGRIQAHIKKNLGNSYCTILLIGYCAEGTIGAELAKGKKSVRINGKEYQVAAQVEQTDIFSGHVDKEDLITFVKQHSTNRLKRVFLVHGEEMALKEFSEVLEGIGYSTIIPEKGESFILD